MGSLRALPLLSTTHKVLEGLKRGQYRVRRLSKIRDAEDDRTMGQGQSHDTSKAIGRDWPRALSPTDDGACFGRLSATTRASSPLGDAFVSHRLFGDLYVIALTPLFAAPLAVRCLQLPGGSPSS